jgi:hypothetical protein
VSRYFDTKLFYEYDRQLEQIIITFESEEHEKMKGIIRFVMEVVKNDGLAPSSWLERMAWNGSPSKLL